MIIIDSKGGFFWINAENTYYVDANSAQRKDVLFYYLDLLTKQRHSG